MSIPKRFAGTFRRASRSATYGTTEARIPAPTAQRTAKRSVTLAQAGSLTLAIDLRTGSTRLDLWPEGGRPEHTVPINDVDDWLTLISSGKARGITAESTAHQYRRRGLVYRPVRDAPPVPVYVAWSRTDPPAARQEVIELLIGLYAGATGDHV
jgi:hypothetical protein